MSDPSTEGYLAVAAALDHALTEGADSETWWRVAEAFAVGLSRDQRAWLLHAAISVTDPDDAVVIVDAFIAAQVEGPPLPALDEIEDSARWWADLASLPELRAWLAACFVRLPVREREEFLVQASRRAAA